MDDSSSDETLMIEYQSGNYQAFETLYLRHKPALLRFMSGLCSNPSVAEELFQEVWMKLIDARHRYRVSAKFTTYLYQIARNRIIDHYRKHSTRFEHNSTELEQGVDAQSMHDQQQPEQLLEQQQSAQSFQRLLSALPFEQREVFLLKENSDMDLKQIAEMLKEKPETIKSRLRYAVNKLRDGLVS